ELLPDTFDTFYFTKLVFRNTSSPALFTDVFVFIILQKNIYAVFIGNITAIHTVKPDIIFLYDCFIFFFEAHKVYSQEIYLSKTIKYYNIYFSFWGGKRSQSSVFI